MLAIYNKARTVQPGDALSMTSMTPTERLQWINNQNYSVVGDKLSELLKQYNEFLHFTNTDEESLIKIFMNNDLSIRQMEKARLFGETMFMLIDSLGGKSELHRIVVV